MFSLIILSAGGDIQVSERTIEKDPFVIGKESGLDWTIADPVISRRHLQFEKRSRSWWVRDLNSTNGTYINGETILEKELRHHDVIQLGTTSFLVNLKNEEITSEIARSLSQKIPFVHPDDMPEIVAEQKKPVDQRRPVRLIQKKKSYPRPVQPSIRPKGPVTAVGPTSKSGSPSGVNRIQKPVPAVKKSQASAAFAGTQNNFSQATLICGVLGFITFLPAIILGHLDKPDSIQREKQRDLGLTLGYGFLALWIVAGIFWGIRTKLSGPEAKKTSSSEQIQSALGTNLSSQNSKLDAPKNNITYPTYRHSPSLKNSLFMWMPSESLRKSYQGRSTSEASDALMGETPKAMKDFPVALRNGTLISESNVLGIFPGKLNSSVRLVLENCLTNPTLWKYNTTVVPEKKTLIQSFLFPDDAIFFFDRDPQIVIPGDLVDQKQLPWHQSIRGVEWTQGNLDALRKTDPAYVRLLWIVQSAEQARPYSILTIEGRQKTILSEVVYPLTVFPSQWIAVILYDVPNKQFLSVKSNHQILSLSEQTEIEALLQKSFSKILQQRPESERSATPGFRLE